MLRKNLVHRFFLGADRAGKDPVFIGHHPVVFFPKIFQNLFTLALTFVLFAVIEFYRASSILTRVFAAIGALIFLKFFIDFLNIFLDCLILTPKGVRFMTRDGLFKKKSEFFSRDRIETVSSDQKWLRDKIFQKGKIQIKLDQGINFPFDDVPHAERAAGEILKQKDAQKSPKKSAVADDLKYRVLLETFNEMLGKNGQNPPPNDGLGFGSHPAS